MRTFDHDYANEVIARLDRIKPGSRPRWGTMTPPQMIGHLAFWVKYSIGKGPAIAFAGNWFTKHVAAPMLLNGWLPIPKNLKGVQTGPPLPDSPAADTETLHAVLETYLELVQAGELVPREHPAFGDIGVDGWAKMHVAHFEHHLKQFGV
ncbi:MAG: DUF1569 domain-containing protein [Candidatus Hydrogenedentes bacterium]|nr:DUF1569 domain-containing protein [Candidatus Hydrogenedentota bacterium]